MQKINRQHVEITEQDTQIVDAMEQSLANCFGTMLDMVAQFKIFPREELLNHYESIFRDMATQYQQNNEGVEWEDMSKICEITTELRNQKQNVADDIVDLRNRINAVVDRWKEDCGYVETINE